ncbi:hypothetical protein NTGZN8_100016 [Candidatus Nitrotoga fabula]|uniref:Uncharacterized protein n=1 Tax=Candidatus Nitrotoga fabula TaxID=2182327 RepID=A0A916FA30_9PROT|nr:hypothetical protein NTGZN8_100016 [Candidatus Nitrotoga fabula]
MAGVTAGISSEPSPFSDGVPVLQLAGKMDEHCRNFTLGRRNPDLEQRSGPPNTG